MDSSPTARSKNMEPLVTEHFDCECYTPEHTVRFTYDPDNGDLYMSVYLWKWGFWKRLWIAVKYIFGYTSKFGDFDSGASFQKEDLQRLAELVLQTKARKEELEIVKENNAVKVLR